jgi:Rrf2 family protein
MYDIPIELLAKVLQRLVRRGLLVSQQGTRGGYQLARVPTEISVADVIQAIDGPVSVTACSLTDDGSCEQFAKCNVRDPLWRVRERILAALGECTVAELAAEPPRATPTARAALLHTHS